MTRASFSESSALVASSRMVSSGLRAMDGLAPDETRLRQARGGQAADVGMWMVGREQDHHDAIDQVAASPTARDFLDIARLRASMANGVTQARDAVWWNIIYGRALRFGLVAAWWDQRRAQAVADARRAVHQGANSGPTTVIS